MGPCRITRGRVPVTTTRVSRWRGSRAAARWAILGACRYREARAGWGSEVEVDWIATDPESGHLSLTERRSSAEEYLARIGALLALGWGYSEVSLSGSAYPHLTLSFRGEYAVVHQFSAEDKVLLLAGDGVTAAGQTVLVPVLDIDSAPFDGAVVLSTEHACVAIRQFLSHGSPDDLGDWQEL